MKTNPPARFWLGLAAILGLIAFAPYFSPLSMFFFMFVWWAYIIAVDGFVFFKTNTSLLTRLGPSSLLLVLCSAFFWCFFELLNVILKNWHYSGTAFGSNLEHALFALAAFGSVLPAFLETFDLLAAYKLGQGKKIPCQKWLKNKTTLVSFGVLLFILPLLWPKYFFGAIWIGGAFIDPIVERWGGKSLFAELRSGNAETLYLACATGLLCGFMWELWNCLSAIKWLYTVPFFDSFKLFEMPIAGYLGYLPFACTCYVFCQLLATRKVFSNIRG